MIVAKEEWSTLGERNTVPEVGCRSPDINFSIVDLPMPLGPTTEIVSQWVIKNGSTRT